MFKNSEKKSSNNVSQRSSLLFFKNLWSWIKNVFLKNTLEKLKYLLAPWSLRLCLVFLSDSSCRAVDAWDAFLRWARIQLFRVFIVAILAAADFDRDFPLVFVLHFLNLDVVRLDFRGRFFRHRAAAQRTALDNTGRRKTVVRLATLLQFGVALARATTPLGDFGFFAFAVSRVHSENRIKVNAVGCNLFLC